MRNPGCDCAVIYKHEQVFRHTVGYADAERKKPLTDKNTYWLYSATKAHYMYRGNAAY